MKANHQNTTGRDGVKRRKIAGRPAADRTPADTPHAGAADVADPDRWVGLLPWQRMFLATLEMRGNVRAATTKARIARSWAYAARDSNDAFAAAWKEALEDAMDRPEEEAWIRAVDGRAKAIYQGGKLVGYVQEYSDGLMVTLLKAHRPEKYRENFEGEACGEQPAGGVMRKIPDGGANGPAAD